MYEYTYTYDNNNIFFAYNIILPLFFIFFFFKYLIQYNYNTKHDNKIIHLFYQKFNWFLIKFIDIIILYIFIWYSATTIYNIIILLLREYLFIFLNFFYIFLLKSINSVRWNLILTIFIIDCCMTMVSSYTRRSL